MVNFNHTYGCQKCLIKGTYYNATHRMSFPRIDEDLRTDYNFRNPQEGNEAEINHHKEYSLFEELPIDMIACFPVSDPLHLLHLGIMKK